MHVFLSSSLLSKNIKVKIHRTRILLVVLYGCENKSLAMKEEHRLRTFDKKVLKNIFGLKRGGVTEEWRRLRIEELHDFYFSLNIKFFG
jgi:hypothetical protein